MRYEKKMLILSGEGKGVVLIERDAYGVLFTLRTFDMPACSALKAGIITRTEVFVRDLPDGRNPAASIRLELKDPDELHFAVFDGRLRLYGTNAKRMWEANVMDLLLKHDRPAPVFSEPPALAALEPIADMPRVLPLPDGTGIPQSRLPMYGDEALAGSDFYTTLDFSSRMPVVDSFLDSPRVLDGLSPMLTPPDAPAEVTAVLAGTPDPVTTEEESLESFAETVAETVEPPIESPAEHDFTATADEQSGEESDAEKMTEERLVESESNVENTENAESAQEPQHEKASEPSTAVDGFDETLVREALFEDEAAEAAAVLSDIEGGEMDIRDTPTGEPWMATAAWILKRSGRETVPPAPVVKPRTQAAKLKRIRESDFFERTRKDVELLFSNGDKDKNLSALLPDIEWIKLNFDGNALSVGRTPAFLCYAVPGTYQKDSPFDEAQWLPARRDVPSGKGYWLIFQNRSTGEILK